MLIQVALFNVIHNELNVNKQCVSMHQVHKSMGFVCKFDSFFLLLKCILIAFCLHIRKYIHLDRNWYIFLLWLIVFEKTRSFLLLLFACRVLIQVLSTRTFICIVERYYLSWKIIIHQLDIVLYSDLFFFLFHL